MVTMKLEAKTVSVPENQVYRYKAMGYTRIDGMDYETEPQRTSSPRGRGGRGSKADDSE